VIREGEACTVQLWCERVSHIGQGIIE